MYRQTSKAKDPLAPRILIGLLATVLIGGVVFALYIWGRPSGYSAAASIPRSVPKGPGLRAPMPTGDPPGWREVFADNFNGHSLDLSRWRVYSGEPGGDPAGWFDPSHVKVADGMLIISGYRSAAHGGRWATGGVSTGPRFVQSYGKYLVRFRMQSGIGIAHVISLFPANGSWPPEVDVSEDNGGPRTSTLVTLHYGPDDTRISRHLDVYLTQWHTLGVEWAPGDLRFTLDGRVWSQIRSSHVPSQPMALDIQTQSWPCTSHWGRCPDATTPRVVRMYVDWVVAYAPAPKQ